MALENYSEQYIEGCFAKWISLGCPSLVDLQKKVDLDEYGRRPPLSRFKEWMTEGNWRERRDAINGRASAIMETELVDETVKMWQKHASVADAVGAEAFAYIQEHGFDSSASALQALKWAQEEERKTRGAEALVSTIRNAANEDLVSEIRKLAARQLNVDEDTVDAEVKDSDDTNAGESA